jgi:DNA-binding NarL/FixJ family response regulator
METDVKHKKKALPHNEGHLSIFLVDDDTAYLYPLGFYLQKNTAHKVYCYQTGEECLKNLYHNPDLIILDLNLNSETPYSLTGFDTLKEIKRLRPEIKVVILSGRDTAKGLVETMNNGAYSYVVKDIEALSSIKKLIDELNIGHR